MAWTENDTLVVDSFDLHELQESQGRSIHLRFSKGWKHGPKRGAARFLTVFPCLQNLLFYNYSGSGVGRHLARIVRESAHLRDVSIRVGGIPQRGFDRIVFAAAQHTTLRSIGLIYSLSPGAPAFQALCSSLSLRSVHLVGPIV